MAKLNDCPKFDPNENDYYTTKQMWENIKHLVPKDKKIYEMCLLNSKSKSLEYWQDMGYNIIGNDTWDCLSFKPIEYDMIITNPPFETKIKQKILKKLVEIDKPFIIILNCMNIYSKYFRDIFGENIKYLFFFILTINPHLGYSFCMLNNNNKRQDLSYIFLNILFLHYIFQILFYLLG